MQTDTFSSNSENSDNSDFLKSGSVLKASFHSNTVSVTRTFTAADAVTKWEKEPVKDFARLDDFL